MIDESDRLAFVYGLVDPRTNEIRYIGGSITPNKRLKEHLSESPNRGMRGWIVELKSRGLKPELQILEETSWLRLHGREIIWISTYPEKFRLLNRAHLNTIYTEFKPGYFFSLLRPLEELEREIP